MKKSQFFINIKMKKRFNKALKTGKIPKIVFCWFVMDNYNNVNSVLKLIQELFDEKNENIIMIKLVKSIIKYPLTFLYHDEMLMKIFSIVIIIYCFRILMII